AALSETADVLYKCTDVYHPEHEHVLLWSDPAIGIDWPLEREPALSARDAAGLTLAELERAAALPRLAPCSWSPARAGRSAASCSASARHAARLCSASRAPSSTSPMATPSVPRSRRI